MPGKVFISCGQAFPAEKKIAAQISDWLKGEGYASYVAIEAQSIQDVNSGIIGRLKSADYYIFIDFRREKIHRCPREYRGSLFTNQGFHLVLPPFAEGWQQLYVVTGVTTLVDSCLRRNGI